MRPIFQKLYQVLHSIRLRLALWFVFILALILLAFSMLVFFTQFNELRNESVARVEVKLEGLERVLRVAGPSALDSVVIQSNDDTQRALLDPQDVLVLFDPSGSPIHTWGSLADSEITRLMQGNPRQADARVFFDHLESNGLRTDYTFIIAPILVQNQLVGFFLIGSPLDPMHRLFDLLITLLIGSAATLVIALAGGFWLADRAMRPVHTITQTARQIGETDLSRRLHLKQQDEIGQLADTFDAMLTRIEAAFARQRQFTADASHELRTPLTIVNLETSRALAAPRKPQEYQRALQVIRSENEFMTRLVNNLLILARMDAGQTPLVKEPLDLSDVAVDVIERLSPLAARNQVELEAGELPEVEVLGDRQYLIQMLTNLIENAIKYTAQNKADHERKVQIETGIDSTRTLGWARVTDSGPGIPAEHLPHLFDRFYRVDKARSRGSDADNDGSPTGSGLGLSIVQWIARLHGGEVSVTSEVGRGSTFTVFIPVTQKK